MAERERTTGATATGAMILAVLGSIAALSLMRLILVPIAFALLLACLLAPATRLLRRTVPPLSAVGSAVVLFVVLTGVGLYLGYLAVVSLDQATFTLPADVERLSGVLSRRVADLRRDMPTLRAILPEPDAIDLLGDRNRDAVIRLLSDRWVDLSGLFAQGFVVSVLVLFLLIESEMLAPKAVRFFTKAPGDAQAAQRALQALVSQVRAYLLARTLINAGLGVALGLVLWLMKIRFAWALGAFVALTNWVPYVGQVLGGLPPVLVTLLQWESIGDAFLVAAIYVALLGIEGYVVTPVVMGKSLDLNGTTVLVACLFWGFLWGLAGLVLAMPITVCLKLVFQQVPALHRWADLMSYTWQPPAPAKPDGLAPAPAAEPIGPAPRAAIGPPGAPPDLADA